MKHRKYFLCVKYPQVDLLEEDLMCVIKAAASCIFRHDSLIAEKIMEDYGSNIGASRRNHFGTSWMVVLCQKRG